MRDKRNPYKYRAEGLNRKTEMQITETDIYWRWEYNEGMIIIINGKHIEENTRKCEK